MDMNKTEELIAFSVWGSRIAPVFDSASEILVLDLNDSKSIKRHRLSSYDLYSKIRDLKNLGVDVLICGAISKTLEQLLFTQSINVTSFICGDVDNIIALFLENKFNEIEHKMPGCLWCCGNNRGRRFRRCRNRQNNKRGR
jgi:predicted Fe-Mo cluster-binding NifX family protein